MKKITFFAASMLALLVALTVMGSSLLNTATEQAENEIEKQVLGDDSESDLIIEINGARYSISWFKANLDDLYLIPNFENKDQGSEIANNNNCLAAINAGFYDENDKPLGLFISDSEELFAYRSNKIMNAILSINRFDTPRITREVPDDPLVNAVQTGPILIENDEVLDVSINTDKNARRSIAAVTGNNELYFLSIYSKSSSFRGPFLSETPKILEMFEKEVEINIADAVNLDGGSASYFKNNEIILTEISPIGALFCSK